MAEDGKTREKVEQNTTKVFVGGIEGSVSSEELRDFFQNYGRVKEAVVLKNISTGVSRGFGFVTFEDKNVADILIRENNCVLKGKRMDVKAAEPKDATNPKGPNDSRGGRRDYGGHMDRGGGMGGPGSYHRGGYQDDFGRGGYQRNFPPRDRYAQGYDYMPPAQYDQYPPAAMYPDYNLPPQQVEPPPVATIAPYAPPTAVPTQPRGAPPAPGADNMMKYQAYQQPPTYNFGQPGMQQVSPKHPGYTGRAQFIEAGYGRHGKDTGYKPKNYGDNQPGYQQQYKGRSNTEQYMGGPTRDYPHSKNRYKPY